PKILLPVDGRTPVEGEITIRNTGKISAKPSPYLYISSNINGVYQVVSLGGFQGNIKTLNPGESTTLKWKADTYDFGLLPFHANFAIGMGPKFVNIGRNLDVSFVVPSHMLQQNGYSFKQTVTTTPISEFTKFDGNIDYKHAPIETTSYVTYILHSSMDGMQMRIVDDKGGVYTSVPNSNPQSVRIKVEKGVKYTISLLEKKSTKKYQRSRDDMADGEGIYYKLLAIEETSIPSLIDISPQEQKHIIDDSSNMLVSLFYLKEVSHQNSIKNISVQIKSFIDGNNIPVPSDSILIDHPDEIQSGEHGILTVNIPHNVLDTYPYVVEFEVKSDNNNLTGKIIVSEGLSLIYNGNNHDGGTLPVDFNLYDKNSTAVVLDSTSTFYKDGHTFSGWNTKPDGTGTNYMPDSTLIMPGEDVILYARWTPLLTTGSLRVTIQPQAAIDAGAQWKRVGTDTWRNSGATEPNVPTGSHAVEFKPIAGWTKPGNVNVTVTDGQTATATGTYSQGSDPQYYPFPDTGQTKCYNNSSEITCPQPGQPFYGQDAQYQPRLPRSYTKLGHGGTILADNALHVDDGGPWIMTRDNVTGLVWELKTNANRDDVYAWQDAQSQFIANLNNSSFGGFSTWRLPSRQELASLLHAERIDPSIDTGWFPKTVDSWYWTATTYAGNLSEAFIVYFNRDGGILYNDKSDSYFVRAVMSFENERTIFSDNGDGTVTDTKTGLMWQKCSSGQFYDGNANVCTGSHATMSWEEALSHAQTLSLAGFTDWRLPNRDELQTLVDDTRNNPAIDQIFAQNTVSHWYWSSTSSVHNGIYAWLLNFQSGHIAYVAKNNRSHVRVVRSGRSMDGSPGSLTVVVEPQGARDAGAQWRLAGDDVWRASGSSVTNLPPGSRAIEFKDISGWTRPVNQDVTVIAGQTATVTGTYVQLPQTGSIQVTIEPAAARTAGAQWRRVGTSTWRNSGAMESSIPVGSQAVEFKDISGWVAPAALNVTIAAGQTATATGRYEELPVGMSDRQWLTAFYVAYWGRAGDPGGLDYWLSLIAQRALDVPAVAENFALSVEAKSIYPYFNSPHTATDAERAQFLLAVYRNLLNREVPSDDEGVAYWVGELREGRTTPGAVIGNIIYAAIERNSTDWLTIWNKIQVAEYFTQRFTASGRTWTNAGLDMARMALVGVTHNTLSVGAGRKNVDTLFTQGIDQDHNPGATWTDPVTGMEFVWVPEGCYQMGCGAWADSCSENEKPVHEVCLDGFWMGKYEVTQGQWTRIMGSNPSYFQSGDTYPVERVSWNDVQGFITALNSQGSSTFRLPTEAEWEFACRSGGREEKYCGGDELDSLGWYSGNSGGRTHEVGTKTANGLGIYDMSGNVWEWVSDKYGSNYYSVSPRDNPQGPSTGSDRVYRGASWYDSNGVKHCRAASRNPVPPGRGNNDMGFRLALSPGQQNYTLSGDMNKDSRTLGADDRMYIYLNGNLIFQQTSSGYFGPVSFVAKPNDILRIYVDDFQNGRCTSISDVWLHSPDGLQRKKLVDSWGCCVVGCNTEFDQRLTIQDW
ncbi:MAG: DUF1566 domain-containing protein, partial [Desulfovibrionales bacterium]